MFYDKYIELCNSVNQSPSFVAEAIGLKKSTVTRWKKGSIPTDATLRKISSYFNVSVDFLLGNTDKKRKAPIKKDESITDEDLKFALFDAPEEITDDIMDEVKRFAKYVEEQKRNGHIK